MTGVSRKTLITSGLDLATYTFGDVAQTESILHALFEGPGFALIKYAGYEAGSIKESIDRAKAIAQRFGELLPQDADGTDAWLVRNEGVRIFNESGEYVDLRTVKGSKSDDEITPHNDGAPGWMGHEIDLMMLFAIHNDKTRGGRSHLISGEAVFEHLSRIDGNAASRLMLPVPFDRSTGISDGQGPLLWAPMFSWPDGRFFARLNPRRVRATIQQLKIEDPLLDHSLDLLEEIINDPARQLSFDLEPGDCLLVNDRRVGHARDAFDDPDRLLIRAWIRNDSAPATEPSITSGLALGSWDGFLR